MQAHLTDTPKPNTSLRRISRIAKWVVVIAGVVWFARFAYFRITLRPTPRPEYWAGQIAALDPPGPEALTATEAEKILSDESWNLPASSSKNAQQTHDVDDLIYGNWDTRRADIVYFNTTFQSDKFKSCRNAVRRVAENGAAFHYMPSPASGMEGIVWGCRRWAATLIAHSRWIRETAGDMNTVAEDWRIALQLGRQMSRPQVIWTESMRVAIEERVAREVLHTAHESTAAIPVRQLADFMEQLRPTPYRPGDYLKGNRFFEMSFLEYRYVREKGDWIDVSETVGFWPDPYGSSPVRPTRGWNLASFVFHDFDEARRRIEWEDAFIRTIPNCADGNVDFQSYAGPGILDGRAPWEMRTNSYAVTFGYQVQTRLEAALTALALSEFRRRFGHYPESLDALVPSFLHDVPIDYVDGKPLRYKSITPETYVLYSIGANNRDDGGTVGSKFQNSPDYFYSTNPDAVFSEVVRKDRYR